MHARVSTVADPSEKLEERLLALLAMVNDWLKFAEAKNGGILALASAAAAVSVPQLAEADVSTGAKIVFGFAEACLVASAASSLASFVPIINLDKWLSSPLPVPSGNDNLYFFGHLARYDPAALVDAVARRYILATDPIPRRGESHEDIGGQIVANARITLWKLKLFSFAIISFAVAAILFALGVLVEAI